MIPMHLTTTQMTPPIWQTSPFADANGNRWVEYDLNLDQYVLTDAALAAGYSLDTEIPVLSL